MCRPYSDFSSGLNNVHKSILPASLETDAGLFIAFSFQDFPVSLHLDSFLALLSYPRHWHFWRVCHLFCRMSFILGVSGVSFWLNSGYTFWAENCVRDDVYSVNHLRRHMMLTCPFINVSFDHLINKGLPDFTTTELTFFFL